MQKLTTILFYCLLMVGGPVLVYGQSTTLGDRNELTADTQLKHEKAKHTHGSKKKTVKLKKAKVKHTAQYEYYARVERVAKEKQKILKKMAAPQYSNPLHYGHKRMPKKNPPHKMKYCAECGIRH